MGENVEQIISSKISYKDIAKFVISVSDLSERDKQMTVLCQAKTELSKFLNLLGCLTVPLKFLWVVGSWALQPITLSLPICIIKIQLIMMEIKKEEKEGKLNPYCILLVYDMYL